MVHGQATGRRLPSPLRPLSTVAIGGEQSGRQVPLGFGTQRRQVAGAPRIVGRLIGPGGAGECGQKRNQQQASQRAHPPDNTMRKPLTRAGSGMASNASNKLRSDGQKAT